MPSNSEEETGRRAVVTASASPLSFKATRKPRTRGRGGDSLSLAVVHLLLMPHPVSLSTPRTTLRRHHLTGCLLIRNDLEAAAAADMTIQVEKKYHRLCQRPSRTEPFFCGPHSRNTLLLRKQSKADDGEIASTTILKMFLETRRQWQ